MKIWVHRYQLHPVEPKNRGRSGALIKTEWFAGQVGYSDLHPWPEFGEPTLDEHLRSLVSLQFTPLVESSMEFNFQDREFRMRKRNAFLGLILPRSHRLVFDIEALTNDQLTHWKSEGFSHIKVKMGRNLKAETDVLVNLIYSTSMLWRLDFNGRVSRADFLPWWQALDPAVKARIDFIEDPVGDGELSVAGPWADDWKKQARAVIRVVKSSREATTEFAKYQRVIFTHGLDHPLGQASALWAAAQFYAEHPRLTEVCGVAATDFFKPGEFSNLWHCTGPRMKPTPGTGFGFDELLADLRWERCL